MIKKIDSFQNRLRIAIDNKGISQAELGRRTGINRQIISDYLHGKYEAKQDNIFLLARELNVSEGWLMGLEDEKSKPKNLDEMAEEYSKQFRSYGDKPISEEQRKAIKEITLAYLKSQGINDSSEDQ